MEIILAPVQGEETIRLHIVEAGYGKWNHAEYEAIQLASKNGVDLPQSIIVTSLGPCLVDSTSRAHKSCTETIIERGIKKAHIGILDNRQADQNLYVSLGLQTTLARNETLIGICNLLNDYFNPSKEARLQGLDKAAYIDEILKNLP